MVFGMTGPWARGGQGFTRAHLNLPTRSNPCRPADEAKAREVAAASGSREASTAEVGDQAGVGSERPSPARTDELSSQHNKGD